MELSITFIGEWLHFLSIIGLCLTGIVWMFFEPED